MPGRAEAAPPSRRVGRADGQPRPSRGGEGGATATYRPPIRAVGLCDRGSRGQEDLGTPPPRGGGGVAKEGGDEKERRCPEGSGESWEKLHYIIL